MEAQETRCTVVGIDSPLEHFKENCGRNIGPEGQPEISRGRKPPVADKTGYAPEGRQQMATADPGGKVGIGDGG